MNTTEIPNNSNWGLYPSEELNALLDMLNSPTGKLLFAHIEKKITQKKNDYFELSFSDTDAQLNASMHRGYVLGMNYLTDIKEQITEELEDRLQEKK